MTVMPSLEKPCIALMGEFSAGKSTLANLMLGSSPLPVQVIATRLPPVRMSFGDSDPVRIDTKGQRHKIDLSNLSNVPLETTQLIQVYRKDEVLRECDIIDMPGISDPNMDVDVWHRALPMVHAVIWCSHATQAWRQSEAAFWSGMPEELQQRSILLLTRIDKIAAGRDRDRVIARANKEAGPFFNRVLPIALLDAHAAGEDMEAWAASGADAFAKAFVSLVKRIKAELSSETEEPNPEATQPSEPPRPKIVPRRVTRHAI